MFRWNTRVLHVVAAVGAFAAFAIGSGAGWYWG
jgi:hypothetical protein